MTVKEILNQQRVCAVCKQSKKVGEEIRKGSNVCITCVQGKQTAKRNELLKFLGFEKYQNRF